MSREGAHEGRPYVRLGGGGDGSPTPVFTGAGSRREDNEGGGCGDCEGSEIPRLRFASLGMTCGGRVWV